MLFCQHQRWSKAPFYSCYYLHKIRSPFKISLNIFEQFQQWTGFKIKVCYLWPWIKSTESNTASVLQCNMHTRNEHHKNKYLTLHSSYTWRKENCYMYTHLTVDQNQLHVYTCNSGSKQDCNKPKSCPRWQKIPLPQNFVMINNTKFTNMWQKLTMVSQLLKQESEETVKKKKKTATWSTVPGHHWLVRTMPVLAV